MFFSCSDLLTSLLCIICWSENFLLKLLYSLLLTFSLRRLFRILIYDGRKISRTEVVGDFSNTQHCRVYSSEQFLLSCVAICRSKIYSILIFIIIMIETVLFILMELLTEFPVFEVLNYFIYMQDLK